MQIVLMINYFKIVKLPHLLLTSLSTWSILPSCVLCFIKLVI
jgi:hypothetical protein